VGATRSAGKSGPRRDGESAGLPYFNPHSSATLAQLARDLNLNKEQFKVW
jgi:hypothetical protein